MKYSDDEDILDFDQPDQLKRFPSNEDFDRENALIESFGLNKKTCESKDDNIFPESEQLGIVIDSNIQDEFERLSIDNDEEMEDY